MASSRDLIKDFDEKYNYAFQAMSPFFDEAERDLQMTLGKQWDSSQLAKFKEEGRTALVINRIRPNINMVCGYH